MFKSLSLRGRFLVAPFLSALLTMALYFGSDAIISSHTKLFKQLSENNLPQVSEVSRITALLASNHVDFTTILLDAIDDLDEEKVYISGKLILNQLHTLEQELNHVFNSGQTLIIDQVDVFQQIKQAFTDYRNASINAIELSTVDALLAKSELRTTHTELKKLNALFIVLSDYHVKNLNSFSVMVDDVLKDKNTVTALAIGLILLMILLALFFSKQMTIGLDRINSALIKLSTGETDFKVPKQTERFLQPLLTAVHKFKQLLLENKEQQESLQQVIENLKDSEVRYFSMLDLIPTGIVITDDEHKIILFNQAAEKLFAYTSEEVIGQPLSQLIPSYYQSQHSIDIQNFRHSSVESIPAMNREPILVENKKNEEFYIEASFSKVTLAKETLMMAAITDVTLRKEQEEKIWNQAHFDALTGLPNRFLSLDRLSLLLNEARRNKDFVAVLFLDLDDFKKVNDTLGHETGDKLLIESAIRLSNIVRSKDTVGRLGGDEFIILLEGLSLVTDAQPVAENLLERFRNPFIIDGRKLVLTASVGIAVFPQDGASPSELLRNADAAMYHSKELGRNTYCYFTDSMNREVSRRLTIEEQINGALKRGEFEVHYQTQVNISDRKVIGAEALLRWYNPTLGHVSPVEFIPIAEQTGLIVALGQYVLIEALTVAKKLQQTMGAEFTMAVNLSPRQFRDPELVNFIQKAIEQSGLTSKYLELEITEGVLMSGHSYINDALNQLSEMGVSLAMDDFGTGYSSLSYLRNYPFDVLKIDRSFINDIIEDADDRELIHAVVAMAHGLKLKVVAEGIETEEQLAYLKKLGCDYGQGYLFSKPVSADKIATMH